MQHRPVSTIDPQKTQTPAFVIEEEILRHNLEKIKYIGDKTGATMLHALKAWAPWQLLPMERKYLAGTEVSSLNEARLGFEHFGPEVHMFAPAYRDEEFADILNYSSTIIFNSFAQWKKFRPYVEKFVKRTGKQRRCGLRINPEYSGKSEHSDLWTPCAPGSRLGIRISEFDAALRADPDALESISGLHLHIFFEKGVQDFADALPAIEKRFGKYFSHMKWINFGGGLKFSDDNFETERFIRLINEFRKKYDVEVHFEPGAAIAWYVGSLVTTILDIVERDDVRYKIPILDISIENHLTDFFVSPELDLEVRGARIERDDTKLAGLNAYKFGGMTCIAGDTMAYAHIFRKPLKIGDTIIIDHAIQYTLIKCTMFNGVQHPSIVLWKNGRAKVLRDFSYKDYKARMG